MQNDYIIEKLQSASNFLDELLFRLDSLNDDDKKLKEADLVSHIERLILVCQSLRGVKIDTEKARQIANLI